MGVEKSHEKTKTKKLILKEKKRKERDAKYLKSVRLKKPTIKMFEPHSRCIVLKLFFSIFEKLPQFKPR